MESLKRFLAVGLLVFGLSAFAANPAYESFKGTNGVVLTTPGIGAARVVVVSGELFQPGSTNLTNWANLPTNVVSGANIWTQSGGTAFPTSAGAVIATNIQSWDKLISKGAFIAETRSRTLTTGTNTLAVLTNSYLLLDSPTNDAASVVVQIGPATSSGQLLFVVNNQTNRAFTIYDGSASGSGIVELQGNFVSTNLGGLILMNQGNWVEVGRFSPAGLTTSATINPSDDYLPYRANATTFLDSAVRHETNSPFNQYVDQPGTILQGVFRPDVILRTSSGSWIASSDPSTISVLQNPGFYRLPITNNSTTNRTFYLTNPTYFLQAADVQEILLEFMGGPGTITLASGTNMVLNNSWVPTTLGDRLALHWDSFTGKWSEQWRSPPAGEFSLFGNGTINTLSKWDTTNTLGDSRISQTTNAPFNQFASDPGVIVAGVLKAHSYLLATTVGQATGDPTGFDVGGYLSSDPSFYRLVVTNTAATNRTITLGKQNYTNLLNDTVQILLEFNGGASLTLSNSGNVFLTSNWVATTQGDRLSLGWNNYNQKWEEQWRYPSIGTGSGIINPTDGVMPVRGNATTFTNSPLSVVSGNLAFYGTQFNLTNANSGGLLVQLKDTNANGFINFGLNSSGIGSVSATSTLGVNSTLGSVDVQSQGKVWQFNSTNLTFSESNKFVLGSSATPAYQVWATEFRASTGSVYLGTNVYADNGANLLRNGVAVGASSGPTFADMVWTNDASIVRLVSPDINVVRVLATNFVFRDIQDSANWLTYTNANGYPELERGVLIGGPGIGFFVDTSGNVSDDNGTKYYINNNGSVGFGQLKMTVDIQGQIAGSTLSLTNGKAIFNPTASATATPYQLGTVIAHTSGNLLSVSNLTVAHFHIASTNGISTPAITAYGAVSKAWQFGAGSNTVDVLLRATNMAEVTIEGVGAVLIPYALK